MALLNHQRCTMLIEAVKRLRVWESMRQDLAYETGDPRAAMPDAEMPADWHATHDELLREACYQAARLAGETHGEAKAFADCPYDPVNPYNIDRVQLAIVIGRVCVALRKTR